MSLFNNMNAIPQDGIELTDTYMEACLYDQLSRLYESTRIEFVNSEEAEIMVNEGMISRKSLVKLTKNDDLSRRTTMAAFDIAKKKNDALWRQLVELRKKEKKIIIALVKKYANDARKTAVEGQKDYIAGNKTFFGKAGVNAAVKDANKAYDMDKNQAMGKSKWLFNGGKKFTAPSDKE